MKISSVTQLCPTLCDPMDCSMPGFPVHHHLLELAQTWVHQVNDAIQPSHPVFPLSSCLQSFPASVSFPMHQFFTSGGKSIEISASASDLPVNIQDWFPLGWTALMSLQSKGLSTVFSNTQFKSIDSLTLRFLLTFTLLHFVLRGKTFLLIQVYLYFLILHSCLLWWEGHLFGVISRRSYRSS